METLAELIDLYGITATVEGGTRTTRDGWECIAYTITLRRANCDETLEAPYYQGTAHTDAPTALDVLSCLLSDAEGYDDFPYFEDWADEYGYDTDSRKAERLFEEVREQRDWLYDFLSDGFTLGQSRMNGEHYDRFIRAERD